MGLLSYLVQGFGWRVGSEVAKEAIDELRKSDEPPPQPQPVPPEPRTWWEKRTARRARERREQDERRAAERAAREKQEAAERAEREIEEELEALKRRVQGD